MIQTLSIKSQTYLGGKHAVHHALGRKPLGWQPLRTVVDPIREVAVERSRQTKIGDLDGLKGVSRKMES